LETDFEADSRFREGSGCGAEFRDFRASISWCAHEETLYGQLCRNRRGNRRRSEQPKAFAVGGVTRLCKPERVYWCDGSDAEYQEMVRLMINAGVAIPLDPNKRPNSIFARCSRSA
jgi:hypothetical protein